MDQARINALFDYHINYIGEPTVFGRDFAIPDDNEPPETLTQAHWDWYFSQNFTTYTAETSCQRDTIWIHASDGSTVGRFSRFGIDIHNTATEQKNGKPECLMCTHTQPDLQHFNLFCEHAKTRWGITITPDMLDQAILAAA